jgi:hypothetical protein
MAIVEKISMVNIKRINIFPIDGSSEMSVYTRPDIAGMALIVRSGRRMRTMRILE